MSEDQDFDEDENLEDFEHYKCWFCGDNITDDKDCFLISVYTLRNAKYKVSVTEVREESPIALHTYCISNFVDAKLIELKSIS